MSILIEATHKVVCWILCGRTIKRDERFPRTCTKLKAEILDFDNFEVLIVLNLIRQNKNLCCFVKMILWFAEHFSEKEIDVPFLQKVSFIKVKSKRNSRLIQLQLISHAIRMRDWKKGKHWHTAQNKQSLHMTRIEHPKISVAERRVLAT